MPHDNEKNDNFMENSQLEISNSEIHYNFKPLSPRMRPSNQVKTPTKNKKNADYITTADGRIIKADEISKTTELPDDDKTDVKIAQKAMIEKNEEFKRNDKFLNNEIIDKFKLKI